MDEKDPRDRCPQQEEKFQIATKKSKLENIQDTFTTFQSVSEVRIINLIFWICPLTSIESRGTSEMEFQVLHLQKYVKKVMVHKSNISRSQI